MESSQNNKDKNAEADRKRKLIIRATIAFVVFAFAVGIGAMVGMALTTPTVKIAGDAWDSVEMTEEEYLASLESEAVGDIPDENGVTRNQLVTSYGKAVKKNEEVRGWIYYPGICDYPWVWKQWDNSYYLNHTSEKKSSSNGAIFADGGTVPNSGYLLLHGHHLRSGKMFGNMEKLKGDTFKKRRYFYVYTTWPDGTTTSKRYRAVAVTIVNGSKEIIPGSFASTEEAHAYVNNLAERSRFACSYEERELDDVVVLHTCDYTFTNAHLLVAGVYDKEVT